MAQRNGKRQPRRGSRSRIDEIREAAHHLFRSITHPKKRVFLITLAVQGGNASKAAEVIGIDRSSVWIWKTRDPQFAEAYEQAKLLANDVIEDEILRRGFEGIERPVFWQGQKVDTVKEYSDTLLIFKAKGEMPQKYAFKADVTHGVSPAMAALIAEWTRLRSELSEPQDAVDRPALPAGDVPSEWSQMIEEASEGEYEEDDEELSPRLEDDEDREG
jgi:hypothetical protein